MTLITLAIDIETTGLHATQDRIIELAIADCRDVTQPAIAWLEPAGGMAFLEAMQRDRSFAGLHSHTRLPEALTGSPDALRVDDRPNHAATVDGRGWASEGVGRALSNHLLTMDRTDELAIVVANRNWIQPWLMQHMPDLYSAKLKAARWVDVYALQNILLAARRPVRSIAPSYRAGVDAIRLRALWVEFRNHTLSPYGTGRP